MRNLKAIAAGSLIGLGSLTAAPVATAGQVDASIGVASAYIFRGVSFGQPQVWGGLDYSADNGFYLGTWISTQSDVAGAGEEVDLYGGYAFETGNVAWDLGYLYYWFPGPATEDAGPSFNNSEIYGGLSAGGFSGYLWYNLGAADGAGADEAFVYVDLNYDIPVTDTVSIGLHGGFIEPTGDDVKDFDGLFDYGISLNIGDFYIAATGAEEPEGSTPTTFSGLLQRSERPKISVGYSWAFENVFN